MQGVKRYGVVVQAVRRRASDAGGRGCESRPLRHICLKAH